MSFTTYDNLLATKQCGYMTLRFWNIANGIKVENDIVERRIKVIKNLTLDLTKKVLPALMSKLTLLFSKLQTVTLFQPIRSLQCSW